MRVVNVVASCRLPVTSKIVLRELALKLCNVELVLPHRLFLRLRNPRVTISIFSSGYMTVMGAGSTEDATRGLRRAARLVQKYGTRKFWTTGPINVNTMTAVHDVGARIDIVRFAHGYERTNYEPELFSAMTMNFGPRVQFKVFTTGKTYVVGCKSEEEIKKCYEQFSNLVIPYLS